ncbi:MAG: molybdenum cofactor guanylyltransferase [Anaerolineales bacterium]
MTMQPGNSLLSVAIQSGGKSLRMGQDKASMVFCGKPLIQWVFERARSVADEILVIANEPEKYPFLDCSIYTDEIPGSGPLGGIYTALLRAQYPAVGVFACDMPFVSPELLNYARIRLVHDGVDVVIPRTDRGLEPFHAVYRRETCLSLVRDSLQKGETRVVDWLRNAKTIYANPNEWLPFSKEQWVFQNLNTREQVMIAEQILMQTKTRE